MVVVAPMIGEKTSSVHLDVSKFIQKKEEIFRVGYVEGEADRDSESFTNTAKPNLMYWRDCVAGTGGMQPQEGRGNSVVLLRVYRRCKKAGACKRVGVGV